MEFDVMVSDYRSEKNFQKFLICSMTMDILENLDCKEQWQLLLRLYKLFLGSKSMLTVAFASLIQIYHHEMSEEIENFAENLSCSQLVEEASIHLFTRLISC